MTLLSQYYRYKGYIFTECSLPYEGWFFFLEYCKSQKKKTLAGFSQRRSPSLHRSTGEVQSASSIQWIWIASAQHLRSEK